MNGPHRLDISLSIGFNGGNDVVGSIGIYSRAYAFFIIGIGEVRSERDFVRHQMNYCTISICVKINQIQECIWQQFLRRASFRHPNIDKHRKQCL